MKKILVVTGHPDDESFGVGASLAKYAAAGVEIHLLCATRGEAGQWSGQKGKNLGKIRAKEQQRAAKILGIKKLEYMDFVDGEINNLMLEEMEAKINKKIEKFAPQVVVTFDLSGISGHLDHVAVCQATTRAFLKDPRAKKLYFFCRPEAQAEEATKLYVWKIWGRKESEITTKIDVADYFETKMAACREHATQLKDVETFAKLWEKYKKWDYFVLAKSRVKSKLPESDLFSGI